MSRPLLAELPLGAARRVLDAGAGTGSLLPDLRNAAPQACVIGADISLGMLRIAQKKSLSPLVVMSIDRLALRPVFDVAVLAFVLFHSPDPINALREVYRVLLPCGTIGLVTWTADSAAPGKD